jgi:Photosystem II reaction centre X protein (PsbX)
MTASLGNFIASLVAGAVVVLAIGGVLVFISKTDRVTRA